MKRIVVCVCALLVACGVTLSPTLVSDANLAVAALQALDTDATLLQAPTADTTAITLAIQAIQTALADLQRGTKTPSEFAQLVNDQISLLAPTLLKDFKANNTITTGVVLLQQLLPVIAADATGTVVPTPAMAPRLGNARQQLQIWLLQGKK
jgi:hypothetical protein